MLTYIKNIFTKYFGNENPIPPGETELDYIPLTEIKEKKKTKKEDKYKLKKLEHEIY